MALKQLAIEIRKCYVEIVWYSMTLVTCWIAGMIICFTMTLWGFVLIIPVIYCGIKIWFLEKDVHDYLISI